MKKILTGALIMLAASTMVFAQGGAEKQADEVLNFKMAHVCADNYPVCEALVTFADKVEELSGGKITAELYANGQLGQENDVLESVKLGTIDMTSVNGGAMVPFVPEYAAFTLPYIFENPEMEWSILNGEIGSDVAAKCKEAGFHLIAYMEDGTRNVYTAKKQIKTADDFNGLKIRTTGSIASQDGFAALGASPTPINLGEVYTALQNGTVDGAENNYSSYYTTKHYEVGKYISSTGHLRVPGAFVMSEKKWNSLSEEQQGWITEAGKYAQEWGIKHFNEVDNENLQKCIDGGAIYYEFPASEVKKAAAKCTTVFEKYSQKEGGYIVDEILNYGK
ncbi:MAG: TRAP transporter substrate-binding protein [Sphaerochaeta sp.]